MDEVMLFNPLENMGSYYKLANQVVVEHVVCPEVPLDKVGKPEYLIIQCLYLNIFESCQLVLASTLPALSSSL